MAACWWERVWLSSPSRSTQSQSLRRCPPSNREPAAQLGSAAWSPWSALGLADVEARLSVGDEWGIAVVWMKNILSNPRVTLSIPIYISIFIYIPFFYSFFFPLPHPLPFFPISSIAHRTASRRRARWWSFLALSGLGILQWTSSRGGWRLWQHNSGPWRFHRRPRSTLWWGREGRRLQSSSRNHADIHTIMARCHESCSGLQSNRKGQVRGNACETDRRRWNLMITTGKFCFE